MLGQETDIILVDTEIGTVHNFGGYDNATTKAMKHVRKQMQGKSAEQAAERFVLISGLDLGIDKTVGLHIVPLFNRKVVRHTRHTASNY